jgi:selenocysteine lyase/cysteine desulfurase
VIRSLKTHFSRALAGGAGRLHLAAHSHHLWPDVTFAAHMQAWEDAARLWDGKWSHVFAEVLPQAQRHVAGHLRLADPAAIAFAPNTHEFVLRLFSALPTGRVKRVLTTDGEFHSFARQAARLAEDGSIALEIVKVAPFETFTARFCAAAAAGPHDLVFFSHVFFNSGFVVPDPGALVAAVAAPDTLVAIDGYHAFMALPVDLSRIQHRVFYLGGGYKYACAGEGACFITCPQGYAARPRNTGWYAAFGALAGAGDDAQVAFASDGGRFMGASFDPSGLYRLNASMRWRAGLGEDAAAAHARAGALQAGFVAAMDAAGIAGLTSDALIVRAGSQRGNFLAYRSPWAAAQQARLQAAGIVTDVRGDVLRVGFGLYHDPADVPEIAARVRAALAGAGVSPGSGASP